MQKKIFQNFKLEINSFRHMTYFFDTIYFLRKPNKLSTNQLRFLNNTTPNIVYLNFKDLTLKNNDFNSVLENNVLNKNQTLILLDFKETSANELLLFLTSYYKNEKDQKNPIIILNKSKKDAMDKRLIKNTKYLGLDYYLLVKYATNKRITIKEPAAPLPKNNKRNILGFTVLNLLSFIFMALFGSTTQYVKMSALMESMTYFMNNQPKNSRIHAVYHEYFESFEERTSNEARNKYSNLQRETVSYGLGDAFNSYFISGTDDEFIEFDVNFLEYENDLYHFKTKIIGQSVYSNQNRILMEVIDLEQYLIKKYAHHTPLGGADAVYYMPSNIADQIINASNDDNFRNYSDFIGKIVVVSCEKYGVLFEQTMSINNIFYTSNVIANIGEPTNENENVNVYSGQDKNLGKHMLDSIGNFGVSTSTKIHRAFGSTFCLEFFGYNKSLKMMLDRNFAEDLKNDSNFFDFFYLNKPISDYGVNLNEINNFYRENNGLFGPNYLYLLASSLLLSGGIYFYISCLKANRKNIFSSKKRFFSYFALTSAPFVIFQFLFLFLIILLKYSTTSIGLLNVVGSIFSLIVTIVLLLNLYIYIKGYKKRVYKIKI